ncbi:MAG: 23S rRNA (uracil-5-)-methyltransferase RumA [Elusimicrobia bacterium RIFOXYA12_FULL_51_18]|nr:MAG: 23S rRNA (uracil-5-)-methyltransferase RumA [Elusimicrobia bacterium RIFOXYA12_FULL_51_18]OGS31514.1 MAG: 23S rRNA (uracil-5-)-methyltransferase RumA [Elusimicrobia bacterium RIFOXYA2_FULL_53_38]
MKEITLEFKKIVGEGKTLGRHKGKVVFAYGVLPGETARVRVTLEKRNFMETELIEVLTPSPKRIPPKEDHYISCSPWQIMDYAFQAETKKGLVEDLLYQTTKETIRLDKFYEARQLFGYRTKIEYSFTTENGKLAFAFHKRGNYRDMYALPRGCALMSDKTNALALEILERLNQAGLTPADLKTLILREAKNTGECMAALFLKRKDLALPEFKVEGLTGFMAAYSNPLSPMSTADEVISAWGNDFITEKAGGTLLSYGFDCFFQNNMELFETALQEIRAASFKCEKIIDLYSGVGAIGLALRDLADKVYAVEAVPNSVKYAQLNAAQNNAANFEILCSMMEKADAALLKGADILVLDPPRAGLHQKVVKNIMELLPGKIIYLSCNPITQGRDAAFFLEKYNLVRSAAFDFYPNTPHVETLLVFEKN